MNRREIAPGIMIYSDVIQGYDNLINDIEDAVASGIVKWHGAYVKSGDAVEVNTNTRDTQTIGIAYSNNPVIDMSHARNSFDTTLSKLFFDSFDPLEKDYQMYYGLTTTWHDTYGILKYGIGQKFTNHIDDHKDYIRRMSTVYYANDNYSGGEINFPRFGIEYKPKANELLCFPSNFIYNHSVSPVIEGTRYAVVSWLQ